MSNRSPSSATELERSLWAYTEAGTLALMTVAWEMVRLALAPVSDGHEADRLAHLDDPALARLRRGAAACAFALAAAPADLSADHRRHLIDRGQLAVPLLQLHAVLLRDRKQPAEWSSDELHAIVEPFVAEASARIAAEAPSAPDAQRLLDGHLQRMASAARIATPLLRAARTRNFAGLNGLPRRPDYNGLCAKLMAQEDLRARWLPPAGQEVTDHCGIPTPREARVALRLPASAPFSLVLDAFASRGPEALAELPGSEDGELDGPRRTWLAFGRALELLASADAALPHPTATATAPTQRMAGSTRRLVADRYALGDELGRGGMGVVYRARDRRLQRDVALKLLSPSAWPGADARSRFVREAQIAARVEHPSVVRVYDAGLDGSTPYVVMALVRGPDLGRVLATGPLRAGRALSRFAELAQAVAAVHAHGIVHRDLKPANVLLADEGMETERAVLTDFGIARPDDLAHATTVGRIVGTPGYIAPEVLAGRPAGPAADQWALARLLVHMLTGDRSADRPALEGRIGRAGADAVHRALDDRPEDRHADVCRFAAALLGVPA